MVSMGQLYKNGKLIDKNVTCDLYYGIDYRGKLIGYGIVKTTMPFKFSRLDQLVNDIILEIEFDLPIEGKKRYDIDLIGDHSDEYIFEMKFPGGQYK